MKLLAIESSSLVASVAVLEDDVIIAEYTTNFKKTHSETLLPMIDTIVTMTGTELSSIDAIAVSAGPGSFTGLRIGAATAKGLALALDKPIVAVPTLDAQGIMINNTEKLICPIMDARRNQVYNGLYHNNIEFEVVEESRALGIDELIDELNKKGEEVVFLGDGVPAFRKTIEEKLKVTYSWADAYTNRQRAAAVATLGAKLFKEGKTISSDDFAPEYLRQSQAEREREEKGE